MAQKVNDSQSTALLANVLTFFPIESILPADQQLVDYAAEVIPQLLDQRLWDDDRTLNAISFLVSRYPRTAILVRLLKDLASRYPTEPNWVLVQAELHHRNGDLEQAEALYQQAMTLDAENALPYLRLGMVAEASCEPDNPDCLDLDKALTWYNRYLEVAPNDVLAIKRVTQICALLEKTAQESQYCGEPVLGNRVFDNRTMQKTDGSIVAGVYTDLEAIIRDRRIVVQLLNKETKAIVLGENLLTNGHFADWTLEHPDSWVWSNMATGDPWNRGLIVGSADSFATPNGTPSIRVDGLWMRFDQENLPGRAGWQSEQQLELDLDRHHDYVLSFDYRTESISEDLVKLWLSSGHSLSLPSTGGKWQHKVILLRKLASDGIVQPIFRLYGPGRFWLDDVSIRFVDVVDPAIE